MRRRAASGGPRDHKSMVAREEMPAYRGMAAAPVELCPIDQHKLATSREFARAISRMSSSLISDIAKRYDIMTAVCTLLARPLCVTSSLPSAPKGLRHRSLLLRPDAQIKHSQLSLGADACCLFV